MPHRTRAYLLVIVCSLFYFHPSSAQVVVTVAGTGIHQTTGDGGPAICAGVLYPTNVATDAVGNLYITTSNSVRMVSAATGIITTVTGGDGYGDNGDGGPAVNAALKFPYGICIDGSGNIYVSEYSGHCVRKITAATGIITTICGNGTAGYSGDGGPATSAALNTPEGICVDATGNIYIADSKNSRIRKITAATGIITTIGGTGSSSYSGDNGPAVNAGIPYPVSVCVDKAGNVYESEANSTVTCRVRKIDGVTGIITTIAGNSSYAYSGDGGLAVNASLFDPTGICVDGVGNVYIEEYDDSRIRKVDAVTGIITTIAGTGTNGYSGDGGAATSARFNNPLGICLDPVGNLYVADNQNLVVRKIYLTGAPPTTVPSQATIKINASVTTICLGEPVDFEAIVTNAGTALSFQWEKNGLPVGSNLPSFTAGPIANGDVITCKLTFPVPGCGPPVTIVSNSVTMTVTPGLPSSVTISANPAASCSGSPILFTATPTNGGTAPFYQWQVNGQSVGANSPTYSDNTLTNGDRVTCLMTSNAACVTPVTALSNAVAVPINPKQTPLVGITMNASTAVCAGAEVSFTANPANSGDAPRYQWLLNGVNTGSNSPVYKSSQLQNGDQVQCIVYADVTAPCLTASDALSNIITVAVSSIPVPAVQVTASSSNVCQGSTVRFQATSQNAGAGAGYAWLLNGNPVGDGSAVYVTNSLSDGDLVSCMLLSGQSGCQIPDKIISNPLSITVRSLPVIQFDPPEVVITVGQEAALHAVVTGSIDSYQWNPAGELANSSTLDPVTVPLTVSTLYQLLVNGVNGCTATKDILVKVLGKFNIPNSFTPNGDGKNDVFRIPPGTAFTLKNLSIFDRWGNKLFTTSNIGEGWDGRYKGQACPAGTYVFMINGSEGAGPLSIKGTVILIR